MRFIERELQAAGKKIEIWSNDNGFSFSRSKTRFQILCSGQDMRYIEWQLQGAIRNITKWINLNDFKICSEKNILCSLLPKTWPPPSPQNLSWLTKIAVTHSA